MKKAKKLVACLMAIGLLIGFAGCGGSSESADVSGKKYIIATDTVFAPFEFTDDKGNFVGVDVDILAAIAKDQGFEYELQSLGFDAAVAAMESGQADGVIAGMSITDERKEKYDFSAPYYDSGVGMGVAANSTVKSYEDLKGQKVACKTGTEGATFAESIKDQYGFEIKYFKDSPKMYEDVKTGNTVACFEDYPVLGYGISQGNGLKLVGDMEKGSSYGFAVLKGKNTELLNAFDAGLKNIKKNGTYDEILAKYISTGDK